MARIFSFNSKISGLKGCSIFFTYCLVPRGRLCHLNISARLVAFADGGNRTWAAFAASECSFHNTITYPDIRTLWLPLAKFVIWIYWVERRGGFLTHALPNRHLASIQVRASEQMKTKCWQWKIWFQEKTKTLSVLCRQNFAILKLSLLIVHLIEAWLTYGLGKMRLNGIELNFNKLTPS